MSKKKLNKIWGYIYIFGTSRAVMIETEHTVAEIEADWDLREKLVREALKKNVMNLTFKMN